MALKTVPFNVAFTFSRPDPADYEDVNGDTQTAGTDVPRFNYSEGVGEGLMLDASLSEIAAINDIPNFNSSSGTWVIKADLDKSIPIPGSGFGEFMEGSGTLVFVYSNGVGKCWADGQVLFTVDPFTSAEPGFLSNGGLAKIQDLTYYPYAWTDEDAAAKSSGAFSTYFSPDLLFADGTDGFWGDSTDSATLFQSVGGPCAEAAGFCGWRLDKSRGLAFGLEEFENPGPVHVDTDGFAPVNGTLSVVDGDVSFAAGSGISRFTAQFPTEAGEWYLIKFIARSSSSDARVFNSPGWVGGLSQAVGEIKADAKEFAYIRQASGASAGVSFYISTSPTPAGGTLDVSLFSIRRVSGFGNNQYQTTTASKPTVQIVDGIQALVLDSTDDAMLIDVPVGGWSGTFVQGTALGVIVGEIDVPAGPYQIPTDPNYAGPGSDIHTVIVNDSLPEGQLNGLVEWVGQRCPAADFAGQSSFGAWFRERGDLTHLDFSRWDVSNVASMDQMLLLMPELRTVDFSGWDVSNVGTFVQFIRTSQKVEALDVSSWNPESCSSFREFMRDLELVTEIDLRNWTTPSMTDCGGFARNCTSLTAVHVYGGTGSPFSDSPCVNYGGAFIGTNLSQQSYADIVTAIEAAGTSNGELDITGGSATTTGAAQTAVDALRGRGWTVTTPDGY